VTGGAPEAVRMRLGNHLTALFGSMNMSRP
jgi:hypothetical protein